MGLEKKLWDGTLRIRASLRNHTVIVESQQRYTRYNPISQSRYFQGSSKQLSFPSRSAQKCPVHSLTPSMGATHILQLFQSPIQATQPSAAFWPITISHRGILPSLIRGCQGPAMYPHLLLSFTVHEELSRPYYVPAAVLHWTL